MQDDSFDKGQVAALNECIGRIRTLLQYASGQPMTSNDYFDRVEAIQIHLIALKEKAESRLSK